MRRLFPLPHSFQGDEYTAVCEVSDLPCYSVAVKKHREMRYINDTYAADFRDNCNCLPPCSDIQYKTEQTDLNYVQPNPMGGIL